MAFFYFSHNGKIFPIEQAVVPLSRIEYTYGFGVYETIRVVDGVPYFLTDHLDRLRTSASAIELEHPFTPPMLEKSVRDLVRKTETKAFNLKIILIGGNTKEDAQLYMLCLNPLFPDRKLYKKGAKCTTYHYERAFPHAKTLNMMQSYLAYREAKRVGGFDALLINKKGCITEGTRTNFYCIKGKTIVSPPESEILLGVMRKALLYVAQIHGYKLEERDIPLSDISVYDGAFISNAPSKMVPIAQIDDIHLDATYPEMQQLMKLFEQFLKENSVIPQ